MARTPTTAPLAWRRMSIDPKTDRKCAPLRFALRIVSGKNFLSSNAGASADAPALHFHGRDLKTNSLSQSLTALTAPSGREPLAHPQTLCFSRKAYRYAKGPIPEGAVERSETGGVSLEGEDADHVLCPLFPKSSDNFFSVFLPKAALTADFGQNPPGFGQCA